MGFLSVLSEAFGNLFRTLFYIVTAICILYAIWVDVNNFDFGWAVADALPPIGVIRGLNFLFFHWF